MNNPELGIAVVECGRYLLHVVNNLTFVKTLAVIAVKIDQVVETAVRPILHEDAQLLVVEPRIKVPDDVWMTTRCLHEMNLFESCRTSVFLHNDLLQHEQTASTIFHENRTSLRSLANHFDFLIHLAARCAVRLGHCMRFDPWKCSWVWVIRSSE